MRKLLHATAALPALLATSLAANAADMYVKAPPPPAPMPPPFSWTGFYIGGNLGGAWAGRNDLTDNFARVDFGAGNNNNGVFIGGGQVGFNYQVNYVVLGVEGDFDWASNNNNNSTAIIVPGIGLGHSFLVSANNRWAATVAGRIGWVPTERLLFYAKGGGGWVGADGITITDVTTGISVTDGGNGNRTLSGWLVGGGIEWAFADYWSVRFEYDYLGLNNRTFTVPVNSPSVFAGDTFTTGNNRNFQMATIGINYRFNWYNNTRASPVATKY